MDRMWDKHERKLVWGNLRPCPREHPRGARGLSTKAPHLLQYSWGLWEDSASHLNGDAQNYIKTPAGESFPEVKVSQ